MSQRPAFVGDQLKGALPCCSWWPWCSLVTSPSSLPLLELVALHLLYVYVCFIFLYHLLLRLFSWAKNVCPQPSMLVKKVLCFVMTLWDHLTNLHRKDSSSGTAAVQLLLFAQLLALQLSRIMAIELPNFGWRSGRFSECEHFTSTHLPS